MFSFVYDPLLAGRVDFKLLGETDRKTGWQTEKNLKKDKPADKTSMGDVRVCDTVHQRQTLAER